LPIWRDSDAIFVQQVIIQVLNGADGQDTTKKESGSALSKDKGIASMVASSLTGTGCNSVLEIGPGSGILTEYSWKETSMISGL